jgi:hypothetical protein
MTIARSVSDVLRNHVVLEYEAIDRMYLNVYMPHLQTVGAMVNPQIPHHGSHRLQVGHVDVEVHPVDRLVIASYSSTT